MHFHAGVDFSSVVEKQHMRNLVKENVSSVDELNSLLKAAPVKKKRGKPKSSTARSTASAAGTSNSASTPATPDLEALRNQAKHLKNANPDTLRAYIINSYHCFIIAIKANLWILCTRLPGSMYAQRPRNVSTEAS